MSFVQFLTWAAKSIWNGKTPAPPLLTGDLSGKTVLVVGANIGIGLEAARHFCEMNPGRVIIACRSETKGREAARSISESTGVTPEAWTVDLAQFSSIAAFADKFEKNCGRLDILVCNAAVGLFDYNLTVDGYEESVQVNHLACAMLSLLLFPLLAETARKNGGDSRIVQVSSGAHRSAEPRDEIVSKQGIFEAYSRKENCTAADFKNRYSLTKLFNVLFTRAMEEHMSRDALVVANTVDPGYCYSGLRRHFPLHLRLLDTVMQYFLAQSAEEGSRQLVYAALASAKDPQQLRGKYISKSTVQPGGDFLFTSKGMQMQERCWMDTIELLAKVSPKVGPIVSRCFSG